MKKRILVVMCILCSYLHGQELPTMIGNVLMEQLKLKVDAYVEEHDIPALTVALVQDGKVNYIHNGFIKRVGGNPLNEGSVFQIASLSKTFTAIIAKNLIAEEKLDLGASISTYLPEVVSKETKSKIAHITVEDLLHHQSGFPHDGKSLPPKPNGAPQKKLYTVSMLLKDLDQMEVNNKTEKRFSYSNYGYALLGYLMERVSGKAYAALLKEYVIEPYVLKHTTTLENLVPQENLVVPYAPPQT